MLLDGFYAFHIIELMVSILCGFHQWRYLVS
jgi:hypothetical protein